jgi:hypothetical protein
MVRMPEFDLGTPLQAEYRVNGLPAGAQCDLFLVVRDPQDVFSFTYKSARLHGHLRLEVVDSRGRELIGSSGEIGEYIWWGETAKHMHFLYRDCQTAFIPETEETYVVRIRYTPDPSLAGFSGFVCIRRGGTI